MPTEIRTSPENSPLLRGRVAISVYCPCAEEGVCEGPVGGACGGGGALANGCAVRCPSREAIAEPRCISPITIRITGQVLPI